MKEAVLGIIMKYSIAEVYTTNQSNSELSQCDTLFFITDKVMDDDAKEDCLMELISAVGNQDCVIMITHKDDEDYAQIAAEYHKLFTRGGIGAGSRE